MQIEFFSNSKQAPVMQDRIRFLSVSRTPNVCICVSKHICIWVFKRICMWFQTYVNVFPNLCVCDSRRMYMCFQTYVYVIPDVCICVSKLMCMWFQMYVYVFPNLCVCDSRRMYMCFQTYAKRRAAKTTLEREGWHFLNLIKSWACRFRGLEKLCCVRSSWERAGHWAPSSFNEDNLGHPTFKHCFYL